MTEYFDPARLSIGMHVGMELDPYVLNHPVDDRKATWVADQGGRPFVLRFYNPSKGKVEDFLANARKYMSIKHSSITPNYPPFYSNLWVFACSAVCGGEKLYSYLGKYPDGAPLNVVISLFDNMAKGLDQVHSKGLFHGHLDLSSVRVVNGLGVMTGFGSYNWLTRLSDEEMDMRFAPPEYFSKDSSQSAEADRFAFMRLLMAALVGESKVTQENFFKGLPDSHPHLSRAVWSKLLKWSRPSPRHRPKSLVEVIRLVRADMFERRNGRQPKESPAHLGISKQHKKFALIGGGTAVPALLLMFWLWPSASPPEKAATPIKDRKSTPEKVQTFESLPSTLQEPLKDGGKAPVIEKLPPATFKMGDMQGIGDDNEKPVHEVLIPTGFYLSKYEVTFDQYDQFAKASGKPLPPDNGWGRGNRPVINVSWYDAKAYTAWLTEQTGQQYRLPTEIEWEYSVRADSETSYWYGEEVTPGYSVCDSCGSQWDGVSTAPVGSQVSNPHGLFDMHGNVAEWVEDCYHDNYTDAPKTNQAWLGNACDSRVLRGGSWFDIPRVGRSSTRYRAEPNLKASNWGFRVVRIIRKNEESQTSQ